MRGRRAFSGSGGRAPGPLLKQTGLSGMRADSRHEPSAHPEPELTKNQGPPRRLAVRRDDPPRPLAEVDAATTRRRIQLPNRRTARAPGLPSSHQPTGDGIGSRRVQFRLTQRPRPRLAAYLPGRGRDGRGFQTGPRDPSRFRVDKELGGRRVISPRPSRGGRRAAQPATPNERASVRRAPPRARLFSIQRSRSTSLPSGRGGSSGHHSPPPSEPVGELYCAVHVLREDGG
jgi:hypothetical protein